MIPPGDSTRCVIPTRVVTPGMVSRPPGRDLEKIAVCRAVLLEASGVAATASHTGRRARLTCRQTFGHPSRFAEQYRETRRPLHRRGCARANTCWWQLSSRVREGAEYQGAWNAPWPRKRLSARSRQQPWRRQKRWGRQSQQPAQRRPVGRPIPPGWGNRWSGAISTATWRSVLMTFGVGRLASAGYSWRQMNIAACSKSASE